MICHLGPLGPWDQWPGTKGGPVARAQGGTSGQGPGPGPGTRAQGPGLGQGPRARAWDQGPGPEPGTRAQGGRARAWDTSGRAGRSAGLAVHPYRRGSHNLMEP